MGFRLLNDRLNDFACRFIDGQGVKFTSKLATLVELNFTMGNGHQPGKQVISAGLARIATAYGGLKVNKFASGSDGSPSGAHTMMSARTPNTAG